MLHTKEVRNRVWNAVRPYPLGAIMGSKPKSHHGVYIYILGILYWSSFLTITILSGLRKLINLTNLTNTELPVELNN